MKEQQIIKEETVLLTLAAKSHKSMTMLMLLPVIMWLTSKVIMNREGKRKTFETKELKGNYFNYKSFEDYLYIIAHYNASVRITA